MALSNGCESSARCSFAISRVNVKRLISFPIPEYGMNYQSQPLQRHEIDAMKANPVVVQRIVESYRMMLDFYGMALLSEHSGLVSRSSPPRNFATRYRNIVREFPFLDGY